ncbi:MAG: menaquinone biosynthesis protein [Elusimicrobiota bacterium]|jgi:predicted solute-binding protein
MIIRIGYIPYLNMVPFQQGFGPEPLEIDQRQFEFKTLSPRDLGINAGEGTIDAGALSLVDFLRVFPSFEPISRFGVGVRRASKSVLFFSKQPIAAFSGTCAVSEETSTSFRLLQLLLSVRYQRPNVQYGRIASHQTFDGEADGVLLIGDEALRAKQKGIPGLPCVTDLGEEWYFWQGVPFVFARWAVRQGLPQMVKDTIETSVESSLKSIIYNKKDVALQESAKRGFDPAFIENYWNGFCYRLNEDHQESIRRFSELLEEQCLIG